MDIEMTSPGSWIDIRPADTSPNGALSYFGGREVIVPTVITCSSEPCPALVARLLQQSSALETSAFQEIHIELEPRQVPYPLTFKLPDVTRPTPFTVRFGQLSEDGMRLMPEFDIPLKVYPDTLLEEVKPWSRRVQLRLADRDGELDKFLIRQNIAHEDIRVPAREPSPKVVFAVHTGERTFRRERYIHADQTTVIFHEQTEPLAHVSVKDSAIGRVIDVHLKLIDRLDDDPRAQQMLAEIIRMTMD